MVETAARYLGKCVCSTARFTLSNTRYRRLGSLWAILTAWEAVPVVLSVLLICVPTHHSLSAAHTIYQRGGNVLILDKNGFFGGNSTKATSGINGSGTAYQAEQGIPDSAKVSPNQ